MITLTSSQRARLIAALPENFFEKYKSATKSEKMEMSKTLCDYLEFLSERADRRKFIYDNFGIDIESFD